jgi:hypothetical protein
MVKWRVDIVTETENTSRVFEGETAETDAWAFANRISLHLKGTPGLAISVEPVNG